MRHSNAFDCFGGWKSKVRGRPRIPADLQKLIKDMAASNVTRGDERIAAELLLKLGIRVSPRMIRRDMPPPPPGPQRGPSSHRWLTFVRNYAQAMLACDYLAAVTARFQVLYLFVIMEVGRTARAISERQRNPHSSRQSGMLGQFVRMRDYTTNLEIT